MILVFTAFLLEGMIMDSGFMHQFAQQLINGLSLGSIYALIALGYTMIYGILKLINFAHGDIYMVGAYIGYFCTTALKLPFLPSIVIAMAGAALVGMLVAACTPYRNPDYGYRRFFLSGKWHDPAGFSAAPYIPRCLFRNGVPSGRPCHQ